MSLDWEEFKGIKRLFGLGQGSHKDAPTDLTEDCVEGVTDQPKPAEAGQDVAGNDIDLLPHPRGLTSLDVIGIAKAQKSTAVGFEIVSRNDRGRTVLDNLALDLCVAVLCG
eukprot:GDKJ01021814.1.p3 GENE.GDKJ01021814.1~~GDKJ01021814.1.p3  ORF type:complete len:111 (-),score=9.03 GDKJ01021814.1:149-481(-)